MCSNMPITEIDGGIMEGGGQILRLALALSVLQKVPIRVHSIRAGRDKPGLRPQHLKGVEIAQYISGGKLEGATIGSTDILFHPDEIHSGNIAADTKTAGSVSLLIQVALPCALFSNGTTNFSLRGGTNADMAPQIDYTTDVYKPILEKFGATFKANIVKRGYFPRGSGEVCVTVEPVSRLVAVDLTERGTVIEVLGRAFVAGQLPASKAKQMADAATRVIRRALDNVKVKIEYYKEQPGSAVGSQAGIIIVARTDTGCVLGSSGLGARGVSDARVGEAAAEELLADLASGACVDRYAQDQVIVLMALAAGRSRVRCGEVTLHTQTAIHIAQLMTRANFNVTKVDSGGNIIECQGIGMTNKNLPPSVTQ